MDILIGEYMEAQQGERKSRAEQSRELAELRKLVPRLERITSQHKEAERLQAALYAIAELASSAEDMEAFYVALHRIVGGLMYASNFYIAFYDSAQEILSFPYFVDSVDKITPDLIPLEEVKRGLTAHVLRTGVALLASGKDVAKLVEEGKIVYIGESPASWLGVPLFGDNEVTGVIVVQSYSEDFSFNRKDKVLLTFVAQHISTAFERKLARDDLEHRVDRRTQELRKEVAERQRAEHLQTALFSIAELTNAATDMNEFYAKLHAIVAELLYAENFYICLKSEKGNLNFVYVKDNYDRSFPHWRKGDRGLTEYVLRHAAPTLLDKAAILRLEEQGEVLTMGTRPLHWLSVPLIYRDQVRGMLAVQSYTEEFCYRESDQVLLTFVSHHIATALERKQDSEALKRAHAELEQRVGERTIELFEANRILEHQIEERKRIEQRLIHDALHDALTGLPNRNLFMDRLVQAMKRKIRNKEFLFAVLFLDLDRFKIINDSLGHMVGDELLKDVSRRLQTMMRSSDTVARLGGDEFAILMEDINSPEEARTIATRIRENLDEPFYLDGRQVFTSTSVGIAMGLSRYTRPEELLRDADAAMYRAKERGRNRFEVFDKSMHEEVLAQLNMQNDLHRAVEGDEFEVYYQPFVTTDGGHIAGFEALARWIHPEAGLIMPDQFIDLAEETDLIMALDWCIIRKATTQLSEWLQRFPDIRPLTVSINISSKHFAQPDFAANLSIALADANLSAHHVKLEVHEGALLDNLASVKQVLTRLDQLHVRLLLDGFGTRYSSLSNLHRFPMDTLKINRTFVTNMLEVPENLVIVRTIKALGDTLSMAVMAEGIETKKVYQKLVEMGCAYLQGFYISTPLSAQNTEALLSKGGIIQRG